MTTTAAIVFCAMTCTRSPRSVAVDGPHVSSATYAARIVMSDPHASATRGGKRSDTADATHSGRAAHGTVPHGEQHGDGDSTTCAREETQLDREWHAAHLLPLAIEERERRAPELWRQLAEDRSVAAVRDHPEVRPRDPLVQRHRECRRVERVAVAVHDERPRTD